jgi:hypothetical protein
MMLTPCAGFRSVSQAFRQVPNRRRGPGTEHRRPSPATGKRAHRVCMVRDRNGSDSGYLVPGTHAPFPTSFQVRSFYSLQDAISGMQTRRKSPSGSRSSRDSASALGFRYRLPDAEDRYPVPGAGYRVPRPGPSFDNRRGLRYHTSKRLAGGFRIQTVGPRREFCFPREPEDNIDAVFTGCRDFVPISREGETSKG